MQRWRVVLKVCPLLQFRQDPPCRNSPSAQNEQLPSDRMYLREEFEHTQLWLSETKILSGPHYTFEHTRIRGSN
jgi:hypothetical protein